MNTVQFQSESVNGEFDGVDVDVSSSPDGYDVVRYRVQMRFTEPLLGTSPLNQSLYEDYIAKKGIDAGVAPEKVAEEVGYIVDGEKGMTGFKRDAEGRPLIGDWQVRGFLKAAASTLKQRPKSAWAGVKNHKSIIDRHVFVFPRYIPILNWNKADEYVLQRPLRAETMQGPRVALAASECLPAGVGIKFEFHILAPHLVSEEMLVAALNNGKYEGMGQWRSGSNGRFDYQMVNLSKVKTS